MLAIRRILNCEKMTKGFPQRGKGGGCLYSAEFHRIGAGFTLDFSALRARGFAFPRSWDACAARSKAGPVMGLRPLRGPPCIPPETPPKRSLQFPQGGEGTRLTLRELPSLATLAQAISLRDA